MSKGRVIGQLISELPLGLLALPASYGVAQFGASVYPPPVNWALGLAFESTYLGAVILAKNRRKNIFMLTVLMAVVSGVVFNVLHAATVTGLLARPGLEIGWLLAVIHGTPMSIISFCYAMLLHRDARATEPLAPATVEREDLRQQVHAELHHQLSQALSELPALIQKEINATLRSAHSTSAADGGGENYSDWPSPVELSELLEELPELVLTGADAKLYEKPANPPKIINFYPTTQAESEQNPLLGSEPIQSDQKSGKLTEWQVTALQLYQSKGLSKAEIARQVGKSRQAVSEFLNGLSPQI